MDIFKYENEYLEKIKNEKKPHTYNTYKKSLKKFKEFGNTDLIKYKEYLEKKNTPFSSIKLLISVARNFLKFVEKKENITFKNTTLKKREPQKDEKLFSLKEFKRIIDKASMIMDKKVTAFIIYLLATTNLKLSNIQRLKKEHITINENEAEIHIDNKKVKFVKDSIEYEILKKLYENNQITKLNKESSGVYKFFKRMLENLGISTDKRNLHTIKKSQKQLIKEYGINFLTPKRRGYESNRIYTINLDDISIFD